MLLEKEYINFSKLTDGESIALAKARQNHLMSIIVGRKGNTALSATYMQASNDYRAAVLRGIHTATNVLSSIQGDANMSSKVSADIRRLSRRRTKAVVVNTRDVITNNSVQLGFEATVEQSRACMDRAIEIVEQEDRLDQGSSQYEEAIGRLAAECREQRVIENIVNARLEDSGVAMLYQRFNPNTMTFNDGIGNKRFDQRKWVEETRVKTGLSQELLETIIDNGILNNLEDTATNIQDSLATEIRKPGTSVNAINPDVQFGFVTIAATIIKIASAASVAIRAISSFMQQLSLKRNNAYANITKPSLFAPAKEDFNNNGKDDATETFFDKITAPAPLTILAGAVVGVGGNFLPKPESDNFFVRNWNWIAAGILGGIGAFQLAFPTKRWIIGNNSYTAEEMVGLNYVQYNGEWYLASSVSEKSGLDFGAILKGGKALFDTIKSAFDLIKGNPTTTPDGPEFVGDNQLAGGSLDQLDQEGD